jgi:5-oxoprolinase (ATP-hydrolysing)
VSLETKVIDIYLSPILCRDIDRVQNKLLNVKLMFMKSDRGLVNADKFHEKDSILFGLVV